MLLMKNETWLLQVLAMQNFTGILGFSNQHPVSHCFKGVRLRRRKCLCAFELVSAVLFNDQSKLCP